MSVKINTPLKDADILKQLKTGDEVLISGKILVGRDQVHKKLAEMLKQNKDIPVNFEGAFLYYMGPSPAPPNKISGSAGPTTASRMDPFTPFLLENLPIKGIIGKGPRNEDVLKSFAKNKVVYFHAFGGCGALYGSTIKKSEVLMFPELETESLRVITVENFPVLVAFDFNGNYLYPSFK